jgi:hypothetical protein
MLLWRARLFGGRRGLYCLWPVPASSPLKFVLIVLSEYKYKSFLKLSTTDLLVLASMKNAAKCDK